MHSRRQLAFQDVDSSYMVRRRCIAGIPITICQVAYDETTNTTRSDSPSSEKMGTVPLWSFIARTIVGSADVTRVDDGGSATLTLVVGIAILQDLS